MLAEKWLPDYWQVNLQEARILKCIKLAPTMITLDSWRLTGRKEELAEIFTTPLEGFFKLSFDGALKANLGPAGFAGLFWDHRVGTKFIYANHCGHESNNEAKFVGSHKGLILATKMGYKKVIVDGDSQIVIKTLKKLREGTNLDKLSHNWTTTRLGG